MVARYGTAILVGGLVTLAVLYAMQALIAAPRSRLDESGSRHFVDFVRVEREESLQRRDRKPDKPVQPDQAPPEAVQPRVDSIDPTRVTVSVPVAPVEVQMEIGGLGLLASDGAHLPILKIKPEYPRSALNRGIEGHCLVEYTITTAGTVKDVVVVESEPKGYFDKASIQAARKFRYRPRIVNGEPIEVRQQNRFIFELESQ